MTTNFLKLAAIGFLLEFLLALCSCASNHNYETLKADKIELGNCRAKYLEAKQVTESLGASGILSTDDIHNFYVPQFAGLRVQLNSLMAEAETIKASSPRYPAWRADYEDTCKHITDLLDVLHALEVPSGNSK